MKEEEHLKAFNEHRAAIDWAISRGTEKSQRIIGTHASRGIVELISAYLHRINRITPGFQINHRWFKSGDVSSRLPEFPKKSIIISKISELENKSEMLTYGSQRAESEINSTIQLFNEIENLIRGLYDAEK